MRSALLAAMILSGACHSTPRPEPPRNTPSAPAPIVAAPRDLPFAPIADWNETRAGDAEHLHFQGLRSDYELVVHDAKPRQGEPLAQWTQLWTDALASNHLTTSLSPTAHRMRLSSGYAVYWDGAPMKTQHGVDVTAVVYLVVGKDRAMPVVGFYRSGGTELDTELERMLDAWFPTIRMDGGPASEPLYTTAELGGTWSASSAARDAAASSTETLELKEGGAYTTTFTGTAVGTAFTDKATGTWSVDDGKLVLRTKNNVETHRTIWSVDPSRTLRLSPSYAPEETAPLSNPRPSDRAGWFVTAAQ